jgi:GR25 family glycosyltransferase involved in LPS biosynthesis
MLAPSRMLRTTTGAISASPIDVVFVISLRHRTDRRRFIMAEFEKAGIPRSLIRHYPAVVGASVDVDRAERAGFISALGALRIKEPKSNHIWGMDLNPGALGCALSHIDLWGKIAAMRLERALVVEDDSCFRPLFMSELAEVMSTDCPSDWELLYLSGLDTEGKGPLLHINPRIRLVPRMHRTTNCYLVNHKGARRLLETCVPLTYQLDTQMTLQCAVHGPQQVPYVSVPTCYSVHPQLVVQSTRFGSDIQDVSKRAADGMAKEEQERKKAAGWSS